MDRETLLKLWTDSWEGDIWIAPWAKALAGLTPQQAAFKPTPQRHSIWQNVNHVAFWREYSLDLAAGKPKPSDAERDRRNFEEPPAATAAAWDAARKRLADTHKRVRDAIANPAVPLDRLRYHLAHDAYHLGQIMYLRALQGLPPIE